MTFTWMPYIVTETFLCLYAVILLFRLNENMGSQYEVRQLRFLIYAFLVLCVTDIFWAVVEDHAFLPNPYLNASVNAVSVISLVIGCYMWFWFVVGRLYPGHEFSRKVRCLSFVPAMIVILLDVISIFTGWMFYIDADGTYTTTDLFQLQGLGTFLYLVAATVLSFICLFRSESRLRRSELITYTFFMVPVIMAGILEDALPTAPILPLSIFLMLYLLFLMIQNLQIFNDVLTGLNNRRRLIQYLENALEEASEEKPTAVFMLDINQFKSINDRFGHVEGDSALRRFSDALRKEANAGGAFIARYGGDEFCLVVENFHDAPEKLIAHFEETLQENEKDKQAAYSLTASIGYSVCRSPEMKPETVIGAADAMLYVHKREWHLKNA